MKHSIDTYRLYSDEKIFSFCVRVKVTMKEIVDINILRHAVNVAIKRYPYFAVRVVLGEDGGYDFQHNDKDVIVMKTPTKLLHLGCEEVNGHLLLEVTSMADKIFVSFMQLIKETKYVEAFGEVLRELGINYKMEGPYPNIRPKHQVPVKEYG